MTTYVRWKGHLPTDGLEYFEVVKAKWVDCDRAMVKFWLGEGRAIHMNPLVVPHA